MNWSNLTVQTSRARLEELESWLWDNGAVSVTVEDAADMPIFEPPPGEQPVWDEVVVTGLFEDGLDTPKLLAGLKRVGFKNCDAAALENRVWEREWLNRFKPMQFGESLWVCPTGFEKPEGTVIQLDPGLAFGTGTHETTRLCLEYLDSLDVAGWRVLDFGCGSGVLGIGAALKGASQVSAVDNDPQALTATRDNAERNQVELSVSMPLESYEPAQLVFANILAQPLTELADLLIESTRPDGLIILSGIMASQRDWVASSYQDKVNLVDEKELDGWIRLVWKK